MLPKRQSIVFFSAGYHSIVASYQQPNETISPIAPSLQPSSVPFYLQQDLEALRRVSEQYPSSGTQANPPRDTNGTPTTSILQKQRRTRARSSRKLSLDPYTKIKVEKLEVVNFIIFI